MSRVGQLAALLAARNAVATVNYARDWPFAAEARANFGPWASNADGTNGTTATRWNSSGVLETVAQYQKRITYDPASLVCRGLVVEAVSATDLSGSDALNAAVSTARNVTVTANPHIISFTGTGSVTLSGAGSGTTTGTGADRQAFQLVTTTAGTLTLTPSGQVRNLDVIQAASHGQPIVGGTARSTESYQITGADFTAAWPGNAGYIYIEWWDKSANLSPGSELLAALFNNAFSDSVAAYYNTGAGQVNFWAYYGGALRVIITTTNTVNLRARNKLVIAWGASIGAYIVLNGGAATTASWPGAWPQPNMVRMGNTAISGASCMADIARVTFGTTPPTISAAQAMTT